MKNIKKMLACVLSVVTLGACISTIPTSAETFEFPYSISDESKTISYNNLEYLEEDEDNPVTYYSLPDDFNIEDVINGNGILSLNGNKFTLDSASFYGPTDAYILKIFKLKDSSGDIWEYVVYLQVEQISNKLTKGELIYSPSPEDGITNVTYNTKSTVGESEETLQRGDINGDGKINVLDLLQLKKYILKIIDTLE